MSATATATTGTGGARQSARQTRTNPSRSSKAAGRPSAALNTQAVFGGSNNTTGAAEHSHPSMPPGFFPAISHFTDSILALPREVRRHTSLLKEVDAKAWALEENLQTLLQSASGSQPAREASQSAPSASDGSSVASQVRFPSQMSDILIPYLFVADAGSPGTTRRNPRYHGAATTIL